MKNKLVVYFLLLALPLSASHLRCGYISVEVVSSISRTCKITVTVFSDSGYPVLFGGAQDWLLFGDETFVLVPETANIPRPDLGAHVGMARYSILHEYPGFGNFSVVYHSGDRNAGIINIDHSDIAPFTFATSFTLDPAIGLFTTPEFLVDPFFAAPLGSDLSLSLGAFDASEDYDLQYELSTPNNAVNYKVPENFELNPFNGVISWDTKFLNQYIAGEYLFGVNVSLYKKINDTMYLICTVIRDFQIVLTADDGGGKISDNQQLDLNNRVYIPENEIVQLKIFYEATTPTALNAYSELLGNEDAFSFTTYDSSTNENIKVGVLTLMNNSSIIRDTPYQITVRGKDDDFGNDINYLFYTKDIHPEIISGAEDELADVELFPNPAKDFVSISLPENQQARIKVYNQTGTMILDGFIQEETPIDLRTFPSGFYYCRVQIGNHFKIIKLLKR